MTATAERQIPMQRMATIASLARVTRSEKVLIVFHSRTVDKQYRRGVKGAGGKVGSLHFLYLNELAR